jgi:hypothetical protein
MIATVLLAGLLLLAEPADYLARSCTDLAAVQEQQTDGVDRLAAWMEANCPGEREVTVPFCKIQSSLLLDRMQEIGEVASARREKGCRG